MQLVLIVLVIGAATISVVTGVDKGIRILSETNLVLAAITALTSIRSLVGRAV